LADDRIVSVGFLTQSDLDRLGAAFDRHFPIADDEVFADLLAQLDEIEAELVGTGVMLIPNPRT
jgi:hypothetical protein